VSKGEHAHSCQHYAFALRVYCLRVIRVTRVCRVIRVNVMKVISPRLKKSGLTCESCLSC
jgi:hypothetical protein